MNQDALENFFGCLRACQHSSSLIATHFRAAYGTTFIKNLSSAHSIKSNCEPDTSKALLTDLNKFFLNYDVVKETVSNSDDIDDSDTEEDGDTAVFDPLFHFSNNDVDFINNEAIANVSSSVCDKMLKITHCLNCRKTLETSSNTNDDTLSRPSDTFKNNFKKLVCGINDVLPNICVEKFLRKRLLEQLDKIEIDKMGCIKHHDFVESKFKEQTAFYGIVTFTKNVNDLLSGRNKVLPPNHNFLEELAYIFNQKKKHIGKHSDIFK